MQLLQMLPQKSVLITVSMMTCLMITACTKKTERTCNTLVISTTTVASDPCIAQGRITITAPSGTGIQYRLGNGSWQSSPDFFPVTANNYTLSVKDETDCTNNSMVTVPAVPEGTLFSMVKALVSLNCTSCHSGNNPQAGIDLSRNCDIVGNWARIKARAVDGNPSPMPQGGLLPPGERNKITAWINAGHRYTD